MFDPGYSMPHIRTARSANVMRDLAELTIGGSGSSIAVELGALGRITVMATRIDVLLANLQETLKNIQTFMLSGLGGALFFALLAFSGAKEVPMQAPAVGSSLPIKAGIALAIALSVYWIAGVMATLFVARANRLVYELRKQDKDLADAALLFPSVATLRVYGPRIILALLPAVLAVVGSIEIWGKQLLSLWAVFGQIMLCLPYVILGFEFRTAIGGYHPSDWGD